MNWFKKPRLTNQPIPDVIDSILYDEGTFYNQSWNLLVSNSQIS